LYGDSGQLALGGYSLLMQGEAELALILASTGYQIPLETFGGSGFGGTPYFTTSLGGQQIVDAANAAASTMQSIASFLNLSASLSAIKGNFERRKQEWDYQSQSAEKELTQIDKQIAAAEIRLAIAEKDLENHDLLFPLLIIKILIHRLLLLLYL